MEPHYVSLASQKSITPGLQKVKSTRFAIGYHRPRNNRSKSTRAGLSQRLLDQGGAQPEPEKKPLCDLKEDLVQTKNMILGSWVNLLLVFVPFGVISHFTEWEPAIVFFLNFLGMIPIASILGDATECLADHLGETIGGLLNATFGNAVEVVVMILAMLKAKNTEDPGEAEVLLDVVQTSLIGSIFSNSLLVLGCAFVANGIKYKESSFNVTAVSANTALLMISAFVMLLPGTYTNNQDKEDILLVSRAAAVILMIMYCLLLVFVLWTHKDIMDAEHAGNDKENVEMSPNPAQVQPSQSSEAPQPAEFVVNHGAHGHKVQGHDDEEEDDDDEDEVELSLIGSLVLLLIATCIVSWLSEYLVDAIDPMAEQLNMKPAFVGIILLPIIGNAVEHITAIRMAMKNKMDIALSIAIGSATQVAMFVVALAVLVGWIIDLELSLAFDEFEVQLFIFSSIIIFATISDGSSNWLEGAMLLGLYVLIAVAVWHQEYCSGISKVEGIGNCGTHSPSVSPTASW